MFYLSMKKVYQCFHLSRYYGRFHPFYTRLTAPWKGVPDCYKVIFWFSKFWTWCIVKLKTPLNAFEKRIHMRGNIKLKNRIFLWNNSQPILSGLKFLYPERNPKHIEEKSHPKINLTPLQINATIGSCVTVGRNLCNW